MSNPNLPSSAHRSSLRREDMFVFVVLALALVMRLAWALFTTWREDQAVTIWLGATHSFMERPIGLLSSKSFPNPNGMTFIGSLLALAPDLYGSAVMLGIFQMALLLWFCHEVCYKQPLPALLVGLALACEPSVAYPGVDFWNQYTVGFCDLAFIASAARFCRGPSWRVLPLWAFLAMSAPGLYLAGLANAAAYVLIAALLMALHWRSLRTQPFLPYAALAVVACLAVTVLVWVPFVRHVDLAQVQNLSPRSPVGKLKLALEAVWAAPVYAITTLQMQMRSIAPCDGGFPWHGVGWLRTAWTTAAAEVLLFGVAALTVHAGLSLRRRSGEAGPRPDAPWAPVAGILLCLGFVWLNLVLSPLLGGPRLATGGRPDQGVRLIPLLLAASIAAATADLGREPLRRALRYLGTGVVGLYLLFSVTAGVVLMVRHANYNGRELTEADVSLLNKQRMAEAIARDWRSAPRDGNPSIYYRLMSGRWRDLDSLGRQLRPWYPRDVYTTGRGFDYELWRAHHLANAQEGHERTPLGADYIVTYAHEPPPEPETPGARHRIVDRLRLTLVPPSTERRLTARPVSVTHLRTSAEAPSPRLLP